MGNVNTDFLTSLYAVSRDQFLPKIQDNIFNNRALLKLIRQKSQVIIKDGGPNLQVPLMVSANTGVDSYQGYDPLDVSPQNGFIDGTIGKAYYYAPVTISKQEESENSGESQIVNLLAGRMMQAEGSLDNRINGDLFKDGSGNGGKNLTGLLAMIPSVSAPGTYMSVIGGTVTAWKHQYAESVSGDVCSGLDNLFYKLSDGDDKPDLLVTGSTGIKLYEAQNRVAGVGIQYINSNLADAGFQASAYKGMPMILDQAQGTNIFHMLTSKYLGFYYKNDASDFVRPANQLARVSIIDVTCQLVTSNRRRQGKLVATA